MSTLTLSKAKASLGELIDKALSGDEIFIVRPRGEAGRGYVQLVPVREPEPVAYYPPGSLKLNRARIAAMDAIPVNDNPFEE